MNNTSKILFVLGGGVMAYGILRYVYKNVLLASDIDFSVQDFNITQLKPEIQGILTLNIINKSDIQLKLKNLELKAFISGVSIGDVHQTQDITISAQGRSLVKVSFKISPENLASNLKEVIVNVISKRDVPLDFIGNVDIKSWMGYISIPLKYSTSGKDLKALYQEYYG